MFGVRSTPSVCTTVVLLFSKKVIYYGGTVDSYEPDSDNFEYLVQNVPNPHQMAVGVRDDMVQVIKGSRGYFSKIGGSGETCQVAFESILTPDCCIKMDIEGGELSIIDSCDFSMVRKMVIAYHTNVDSSRWNFLERVGRLKQWFEVTHQPIKQDPINMFPNEIMIYCQRL